MGKVGLDPARLARSHPALGQMELAPCHHVQARAVKLWLGRTEAAGWIVLDQTECYGRSLTELAGSVDRARLYSPARPSSLHFVELAW